MLGVAIKMPPGNLEIKGKSGVSAYSEEEEKGKNVAKCDRSVRTRY